MPGHEGGFFASQAAGNIPIQENTAMLRNCVALAAAVFVAQAHGEDPANVKWNPATAAKYMEARADWWLTWSSAARGQGTACVSCHTTMPIALALPALGRTRGESKPIAVETKLMDTARK